MGGRGRNLSILTLAACLLSAAAYPLPGPPPNGEGQKIAVAAGAKPARLIQHLIRHQQARQAAGGLVQRALAPRAAVTPLGGTWTLLGPQPINGLSTFSPSAGRVTAIAASGSTVYAGASDGGVWRSPDGGLSWSTNTDGQATLAIGALAVDWTTPGETVYAATGEGNRCQDCLPSQGVLKSGPGGNGWTLYGQATFTAQPTYFTGLAVNGSTVVAATSQGLFQSSDAGVTWPATPAVSGHFDALVQDPSTATLFWAAMTTSCRTSPGPGAIGTLDTSVSPARWTQKWPATGANPPADVTRIGVGVGPNHTVFAAVAACASSSPAFAFGQLEEVIKSTDGGASWAAITPGNNATLKDYFGPGEQGWYNNAVAVDPANAAHAVFGGVTMLATSDGGASFVDVGKAYAGGVVHPDFHAFAFDGGTLYAGNDGGVYSTTDLGGTGTAADWHNHSAALPITQFYSGTAIDLTHLSGGSQDNGTAGNPQGPAPAPWVSQLDGDGGWTAIIPGKSTIFAEGTSLDIFQVDYSGTGPEVEVAPCPTNSSDPSCSEPTGFIAPFVMDPTSTAASTARLYGATSRVYRTTTGGLPAGGTTASGAWSAVSGDLTNGTGAVNDPHPSDFVNTMALGGSKFPGTLLTGSWFGKVWFSANASSQAPAWTDVTRNLPLWTSAADSGNAWVTGLAINPLNGVEAWVTIGSLTGNRVWHTGNITTDQWSPISTTLPPSLVVDSIAVDPLLPQNLYIGTDTGALACATCGANGGTVVADNWVPLGSAGLPNVRVETLSLTQNDVYLVAWTHGRGAWSLPRPYPTPGASLSPSAVDFGSQRVGTTSPAQTVNLSSSGTAPLHVSNVSISGDFVADQTSQASPCPAPPFVLAPGTSCNFGVDFTPKAAGVRSGALTVTDDAADSPQSTSLSGTGSNQTWESLGGLFYSGTDASASGPNRLDVFIRGADNALWHRWFNGRAWSNWESLGGPIGSDPSAVASANGRIDVFVRGTDSKLWQRTFDGVNWGPWQGLDGVLGSAPDACSPAPGRLDVFVEGSDRRLWHKTFSGTWGNWTQEAPEGVLDAEPSAVSWGGGRMDVFIRGTDKQLWHRWFDGNAWHNWEPLGGVLGSGPDAGSWGTNRLDVFARGTNGQLWHTWWDGTVWTPWTNRDNAGAVIASGPGVAARSQGLLDVFARGTDNALWHVTISGS